MAVKLGTRNADAIDTMNDARDSCAIETTTGNDMITQAIATIAGSIALMVSPVTATHDAGTADEQIQACVTYAADETYYDSQSCIREVVYNNRLNDTITECEWEDSTNCIWMRIDDFGSTFVDVDGIAYYMRGMEMHTA